MDSDELRFFLQGATTMDLERPNPTATLPGSNAMWMKDRAWGELLALGR
jgi:hypothetical protein